MLALYRSAREVVGLYQDLRQLYEMAVDAYKRREPPEAPEIELIEEFRACRACTYDPDPLMEGEAEPWDSGWSIVGCV